MSEQFVTLFIKMPYYASLMQCIYNVCAFIAKLFFRNFAQQFGSLNSPMPKLLTFRNSVCVCMYICVLSVFRIVNETSTEASLVPGIDQLCSTNSWQGVHKVHTVVQLGLSHEFA
jgi:nicotinamide riboside transporter PnuC